MKSGDKESNGFHRLALRAGDIAKIAAVLVIANGAQSWLVNNWLLPPVMDRVSSKIGQEVGAQMKSYGDSLMLAVHAEGAAQYKADSAMILAVKTNTYSKPEINKLFRRTMMHSDSLHRDLLYQFGRWRR